MINPQLEEVIVVVFREAFKQEFIPQSVSSWENAVSGTFSLHLEMKVI